MPELAQFVIGGLVVRRIAGRELFPSLTVWETYDASFSTSVSISVNRTFSRSRTKR